MSQRVSRLPSTMGPGWLGEAVAPQHPRVAVQAQPVSGWVSCFLSPLWVHLGHAFFFFSQMGTGQTFNSQFLQHGGPRGPSVPPGMTPTGMGGMIGPSTLSPMTMNPTRAAGLTSLYAGQRLPQHSYPGSAQAQPLPRQGVKRTYSEVRGSSWCPAEINFWPCYQHRALTLLSCCMPFPQVYPGQQYLQGGQYTPSTAQYAPGPGQPPAPSPSYPGHRLPLQQGLGQSLPVPGPTGLHYKVGPAPKCLGTPQGP